MTKKLKIKNSIHSFSSEKGYTKKEYLSELLRLQDELVEITFGKDSTYKIWNVLGKYNDLSKRNGNIAYDECRKFYKDVSTIVNQIKAEISGSKGEQKAFRSLETLMCENRVIKNVPLQRGNHRSELDAIVLTGKAIFLIEVKNTKKDIHITDQGNFYRVNGSEKSYDSNIGEKMNDKVYLLKSALEDAGIKNIKIESLVVFTNYEINVTNDYPYIKTCFLSDLPKIIESYDGKRVYKSFQFNNLEMAIKSAQSEDYFKAPVDIDEFKENYANLVTKIEDAENNLFVRIKAKIRDFINKILKTGNYCREFAPGV